MNLQARSLGVLLATVLPFFLITSATRLRSMRSIHVSEPSCYFIIKSSPPDLVAKGLIGSVSISSSHQRSFIISDWKFLQQGIGKKKLNAMGFCRPHQKLHIFFCLWDPLTSPNITFVKDNTFDPSNKSKYIKVPVALILLMEEILHHLGCVNPVNNGINYISTGAGFLPSTVWFTRP